MTVEKLKRQFLASLIMVGFAFLCLVGSTYAWFAMNDTVIAESISISAQTAKNLSISLDGVDYYTTVQLDSPTGDDAILAPVAAVDDTTFIGNTTSTTITDEVVFYCIEAANKVPNPDAKDATVPMQTALTSGGAFLTDNFHLVTTPGGHYVAYDTWLRYDANSTEPDVVIDGTVTITLPSGSAIQTKDITKAYHVAIVDEDNNWTMHEITSATDEVATLSFPALFTLSPNTPEQFQTYIWFEGEDSDCFTTAALNGKLLNTLFTFKIAD